MHATILSRGDSLKAFSGWCCLPKFVHSFSFHSFAATAVAGTDYSQPLMIIELQVGDAAGFAFDADTTNATATAAPAAAGETIANAAVAGITIANAAAVAGMTIANAAAVAGMTIANAAVAADDETIANATSAAGDTIGTATAANYRTGQANLLCQDHQSGSYFVHDGYLLCYQGRLGVVVRLEAPDHDSPQTSLRASIAN